MSQGSHFSRTFVAALLAALSLVTAASAQAAVSTSQPGSACFAGGDGTSWSSPANNGYSRSLTTLTDTASGSKNFICPLTRANASSTGTVYMQLQYTRANVSSSYGLNCVALVADVYGNLIQGANGGTIIGATTSYFPFGGLPGQGGGVDMISCNLGQNDYIRAVDSTEY